MHAIARYNGFSITTEMRAHWEWWWKEDLRHPRTEYLQDELDYTARELDEAFDDPLIKAGYLDDPTGRVAGLVLRHNMLAQELRRRQRWIKPDAAANDRRKAFVDFTHDLKQNLELHVYLAHQEGLALKRMGACYEGLCPFHAEHTPSFIVHPQRYMCFGCGAHGDVFDYLQMANRADSLHEAVRIIADYQGVAMPTSGPKPIWAVYAG